MVKRADGIHARVLVAVVVLVGGASWVVLELLQGSGRDLPTTSCLAVFIFVALALGPFVAGRPVKRLVAGRATRTFNPSTPRASPWPRPRRSPVPAIVGWDGAQILLLLPDRDIASQQLQMLVPGSWAWRRPASLRSACSCRSGAVSTRTRGRTSSGISASRAEPRASVRGR